MATCTKMVKNGILKSGKSCLSRNDYADTLDNSPSACSGGDGDKKAQYEAYSQCESNDTIASTDLESHSSLPEHGNPFFGLMTKNISTEMLEDIYTEMLLAIDSCKATSGTIDSSISDIHHYLEELIPLSWESKNMCARKACFLTAGELYLDVRVMEAQVIKEPSHYDRLFCQLWMDDFVKDMKVTRPVSFCKKAFWNSIYRLKVKDWGKSSKAKSKTGAMLSIEVRRVRSQILPAKSNLFDLRLPKFFGRSTPPGNQRIGIARLRLEDIPCQGCFYPSLEIRSMIFNRKKGSISVQTNLKTTRKSEEIVSLRRHLILIRLCFEEALKNVTKNTLIHSLKQFVPLNAMALIRLHGFMANVSLEKDYMCAFVVVSEILDRGYLISYQFIYKFLDCEKEMLHLSWKTLNYFLKDVYVRELKKIIGKCVYFMENLHSFDISGNKIHQMNFEFSLKIMNLCNGFLGLSNDPIVILKSESAGWFERLRTRILSLSENQANELIEIVKHLLDFQSCADKCIERVFTEMTYSEITCEAIENFLKQSIKVIIQKISQNTLSSENGIDTIPNEEISVFVSIRKLIEYTSREVKSPNFDKNNWIKELRNWFGFDVIEQWFSWRTKDSLESIEMIPYSYFSDTMKQICYLNGEERLVSTYLNSACTIIIHNLVDLWNQVSRPSSPDFNSLFFNGLFKCCKAYANKLIDLRKECGDMKNKSVRKRYFILANDIQATAEFIYETVALMKVEAPSEGELLIQGFRDKVVIILTDALEPLIDEQFAKVVEEDSKLKQEMMIKEFIDFLQILLKEAQQNMMLDVFLLFLTKFYRDVKGIILARAGEETSSMKWNSVELLEILKRTEKFWKQSHLDENREMSCELCGW